MNAPIALTLGDPAGIGGEIALRAWAALRGELPFFLIGDVDHVTGLAARLKTPTRPIDDPREAACAMREGLPVLHEPLPEPATPGRLDPRNAPGVVAAIRRGVALVRGGAARALCTGPVHKRALKEGAGFPFPGHTEFLAALCGAPLPVMLIVSPLLRVAPATLHLPLADVPAALTPALIEGVIRVLHAGLVADFGLEHPRIAVAGLNPHAGEGGAIGREEREIIAPALERLRAEGFALAGPLPADTMFHAAARARYDAAVCMYHDQALIPLKTLDFAGGVNVTLGLDFVRTSPDHGVALDIAADLVADPTSLIAALRLAAELGSRRAARG